VHEIKVDMGNKQIAIQVEEDATLEDITAAMHKQFKKAPLKPLKLEPVEIEVSVKDINTSVDTTVNIPEAKLLVSSAKSIADSVLQSQSANAQAHVKAIAEIKDLLESSGGVTVELPEQHGWDVEIKRDGYGNITNLKFKPDS